MDDRTRKAPASRLFGAGTLVVMVSLISIVRTAGCGSHPDAADPAADAASAVDVAASAVRPEASNPVRGSASTSRTSGSRDAGKTGEMGGIGNVEGVVKAPRGATGLSAVGWTARLRDADVARVLAPFESDDRGLHRPARELWRLNGLRVVRVPTDQVEQVALQLGLRPSGSASQHLWLTQSGGWTELIGSASPGAAWKDGGTIRVDTGPLQLGAGRLRLLARGWVSPRPPDGAGLMGSSDLPLIGSDERPADGADRIPATNWVELIPQHLRRNQDRSALAVEPSARGRPGDTLDDGLVFWRLLLRAKLEPDWSLIIVGEDPDASWDDLARGGRTPSSPGLDADAITGAPPPGADEEGSGVNAGRAGASVPKIGQIARLDPGGPTPDSPVGSAATGRAGPPAPLPPTIGEAMMIGPRRSDGRPADRESADGRSRPESLDPPATDRGARSFLLLVPQGPRRFELIGR